MKTVAELSLSSSFVGTGSGRVFPVSENLWCHLHAAGSGQAEAHIMSLEVRRHFFVCVCVPSAHASPN